MSELHPLWFHDSLGIEALRRKRLHALRSGQIPPEFHYLGTWQSQLWLEVHRTHSPAATSDQVISIYDQLFQFVSSTSNHPHLIGLGTGGAAKEKRLLEKLEGPRRFTPIDVSPALAMTSRDTTARVANSVHPVAADLLSLSDLPGFLTEIDEDQPRIYTLFGILPNMEAHHILPKLKTWLRPDDLLLLSANLAPVSESLSIKKACEKILPQYDNPETLRWLSRLLIEWGWADHLTPLCLETKAIGEFHGVVGSAQWKTDLTLDWEGESTEIKKGTPLEVFFSLRYTPAEIDELLLRYDLKAEKRFLSDNQEEGVWAIRSHRS